MICERLQFGYRFMNRMKPASDTNMPEGTVMDLRSARHLPPFSVESRDTDMRQISEMNGCGGAQNFVKKNKTFKHILSLTDHLQQGGGYQVSIPISDFIHPIVP